MLLLIYENICIKLLLALRLFINISVKYQLIVLKQARKTSPYYSILGPLCRYGFVTTRAYVLYNSFQITNLSSTCPTSQITNFINIEQLIFW